MDAEIYSSVGPAVYTYQAPVRVVDIDPTVVSRIITGPPFTDGLNTQMVAVAKAKAQQHPVLTIIATGDSITAGSTDVTVGNGYRAAVNTTLLGFFGASAVIEWDGPNLSPDATDPTRYTNGTGGASSVSLNNEAASKFGAGGTPSRRLPDVLVVMCGTNDAVSGTSAGTYDTQYRALITNYHSLCPAAKIVVCFTPENPFSSVPNALVTAYNAQYPATWTALEGLLGITLYRTPSTFGLTTADMAPGDHIHPNDATGYPKLAAQIGPPVLAACQAV